MSRAESRAGRKAVPEGRKASARLSEAAASLCKTPAGLSDAGASLWCKLATAYKIDDPHGEAVLVLACRAADRLEACRKRIEKDGVSVRDRFNQVKPHPLLSAERDARAAVLAALRQLSLPIPEV